MIASVESVMCRLTKDARSPGLPNGRNAAIIPGVMVRPKVLPRAMISSGRAVEMMANESGRIADVSNARALAHAPDVLWSDGEPDEFTAPHDLAGRELEDLSDECGFARAISSLLAAYIGTLGTERRCLLLSERGITSGVDVVPVNHQPDRLCAGDDLARRKVQMLPDERRFAVLDKLRPFSRLRRFPYRHTCVTITR